MLESGFQQQIESEPRDVCAELARQNVPPSPSVRTGFGAADLFMVLDNDLDDVSGIDQNIDRSNSII